MRKAVLDATKLLLYLERNGFSINAFSKETGISKSRLYAFFSGNQEASGNIWSKLVGYFGEGIIDYIIFFEDKFPKKGTRVVR